MNQSRIWVEEWSPEYGASSEIDEAMAASEEEVDAFVETNRWLPIRPGPSVLPATAFVDGVDRVEARALLDNGLAGVPGLFGSVGAGAVLVDRTATFERCVVRRSAVFAPNAAFQLPPMSPSCRYEPRWGAGSRPEELRRELQRVRTELEEELCRELGRGGYLVLADGPLRVREPLQIVGFIKRHHKAYLGPDLLRIAQALERGERTPLFQFGEVRPRFSWYVRLAPPGANHPSSALARCEVSTTLGLRAAVRLADLFTHHLPRFASKAFWDARAPQNLVPIAALERRLWSLLGDRQVVYRRLRSAFQAREDPSWESRGYGVG